MAELDPNLEMFEKYLNGELSPAEVVEFEKQLRSDNEFANAFEEHKNLRQGIEWASISQSLDQVKRMHEAMSDEEIKLEEESSKTAKSFKLNRLTAMAATLLLGILATTIYFKTTNAGLDFTQLVNLGQNDTHLLYGSGGENMPLIDQLYPVGIEAIPPTENQESKMILFQLFAADRESFVIDTNSRAVVLFTPYIDIIEDFEQQEFVAKYQARTDEVPSTFHLISAKAVFSLPMSEKIFNQLTKR